MDGLKELKDLLYPKTYNPVAFTIVLFYQIASWILTGLVINNNINGNFVCSSNDDFNPISRDKTFIQRLCQTKYNRSYNSPSLLLFVLVNFLTVTAVCVLYSVSVKNRVEEVKIRDPKDKDVFKPVEGNRWRVFGLYVLHLVTRCLLGLLFTWLQKAVLYPSGFPLGFQCSFPTRIKIIDPTSNKMNYTLVSCFNSPALGKNNLLTAVSTVNVVFACLALVEIVYLVFLVYRNLDFGCDLEFCNIYLLVRGVPIGLIIKRLKKEIVRHYESTVFERNIPSGLTGTVREMYVDLIMHSGRAEHRFSKIWNKHEIYHVYTKVPEQSIPIKNPHELFLPNSDTDQKVPCSILVTGRPGIGKSTLSDKIVFDLARESDTFYKDKIGFLVKFRWFNSTENQQVTLKDLLKSGTQLDESEFVHLFQYCLAYPKKVVIILDGLDELKMDNVNGCDGKQESGSNTEAMHVYALFTKLVNGEFLPGATVLTTSRPTADGVYSSLKLDREAEILGFTDDKIHEYVNKFCKDYKLSNRSSNGSTENEQMWSHILETGELLNLCYIPVNCFIVCLTLMMCIKCNAENFVLPTTLTELYRRAVRIFFFKHYSEYREKQFDKDQLNSDEFFSDQLKIVMARLQDLALKGIEEKQLIFEEKEVTSDMADCGLLHSLPNEHKSEYCFLHLTMQEFLAAKGLVDSKSPEDVDEFIKSHLNDSKWHLVIQFVFGLLKEFNKSSEIMKYISSFLDNSKDVCEHFENITLVKLKCLCELRDSEITTKFCLGINREIKWEDVETSTPSDCDALVYFLCHLKCNASLKLSISKCNQGLCSELAELFQMKTLTLRKLYLGNCKIGDEGLQLLLSQGVQCQVDELALCGNSITDDGMSCLCEALSNGLRKLTNLDLEDNDITIAAVSMLCEVLKNERCALTHLSLGRNEKLEGAGVPLRDALISQNCQLTDLNLSSGNFSDEDLSHLSAALSNANNELEELDLSINEIGTEGVSHLCNALTNENCKLVLLMLYCNNISDEGASLLFDALANENCELVSLHVMDNDISDESLPPLLNALINENFELSELELSGNNITDNYVDQLCVALEDCKLSYLCLTENKLTEDGKSKLRAAQTEDLKIDL